MGSIIDRDAYLSDLQARHVFHICHEALSNAVRHAKPKQISLGLKREGRIVTVWVKDNGLGFKNELRVTPGHHGVANMQARAAEIGGTLLIESSPQQGTTLTLTFRSVGP